MTAGPAPDGAENLPRPRLRPGGEPPGHRGDTRDFGQDRGFIRRVNAVVLAAALVLSALVFSSDAYTQNLFGRPDPPARIQVDARVIDTFINGSPEQRRFGSVEFLGGIELKAAHQDFGGLSALRVEPDGERFVSLSDKGRWLTGRITYDAGGHPAGIADAVIAPMIGPDGRTLASRGWYDTESLAVRDGTYYVGIERANRIVRFDFAAAGVLARAEVVPVPLGISKLPNNKGLEAMTFGPPGGRLANTLIAFSERGLDAAGNNKAFLLGGAATGEFSVKRRDDFDISDCTLLPSGDLLLLERRFAWTTGIAMRLRRIPIQDIAPGALVDGPVLLLADMRYQIDNMEGISAHRAPDGSTILTLISDDNFSILQRTILLQFKVVEE